MAAWRKAQESSTERQHPLDGKWCVVTHCGNLPHYIIRDEDGKASTDSHTGEFLRACGEHIERFI